MSWSGFKKNVGRATTQVMMKTGHVEKTSDRDYEVEERRYRTLESASLRLQKEAKGYLDSLRAMTASQMRIAETIDAFYGDSGARDGVSRSYKQAVEDLDAETVKALDGPYRCVSKYPKLEKEVPPPPGVEDDEVEYRKEVLEEVEAELNFSRGNARYWTKNTRKAMTDSEELMEHVYRTTVLEPINRFCAYFPDINECIKKRNHKMLDYDAMRSKVKKLTEKPDKDPGKLPRTEKETEMVKHTHHPRVLFPSDDLSALLVDDLNHGSVFPSPPKVLNELKHKSDPDKDILAEVMADEDAVLRSVGLKPRSSVLTRLTRARSAAYNAFWGLPQSGRLPTSQEPLIRSPSRESSKRSASTNLLRSPWLSSSAGVTMALLHAELTARHQPLRSPDASHDGRVLEPSPSCSSYNPSEKKRARDPTLEQLQERSRSRANMRIHPALRSTEGEQLDLQPATLTHRAVSQSDTSKSSRWSRKSSSASAPRTKAPSVQQPGHWFNPSELEQILQPIKEAFMEEQADLIAQAKAAYEQLNDQLTDELPKLIDLRVPYLDPSFEALVKIQLRFCAEAYSRMAQVQQYLDASTRDQYASGDLDARVEDVLGQIRELSIAGTV